MRGTLLVIGDWSSAPASRCLLLMLSLPRPTLEAVTLGLAICEKTKRDNHTVSMHENGIATALRADSLGYEDKGRQLHCPVRLKSSNVELDA